MKYYSKKLKMQVPGLKKDAYTTKSLSAVVKISGYLKAHLAFPLKWRSTCGQTHCRRILCLPSFDSYSFELLLTILNGNLGSTGTHFSLADILSFFSFFLLGESYVHSLFSKYMLLEDT